MQRKSKNCLFTVTVFLLILWSGSLTQAKAAMNSNTDAISPANKTVDKDIVAMVNGTEITRKQFNTAMDYQVEMAQIRKMTLSTAELSEVKYQIVENLIDEELLYQESRKSGIKIEKKEIDDTYEEGKKKARFETDAEFEEALKKTDKSIASYRDEIEFGLAIDRFIKKKFTDNTVISDSEAKQYYDSNIRYFQQPAQVRVSHILIRVAKDADQSVKDEATQKLEQAMKRLKAGEDFAVVAKEVSEDGNTKDNAGDLGYISLGYFEKSFEDAVSSLQKGELSGIVETSAGYHILKVTDKKDAKTITFEEAKNDIVNSLKQSKVNSLVSSYVKELRLRSTIVTYPIIK